MITSYPKKRTWVFMPCYFCKSEYTELYVSLGQFNYNGFKCYNCRFQMDF